MPQTKGQGVVFGILMSVFMAYGMELYNVAAKVGGMENKVFWLALKEAAFMCVFVFVFSTLFGNRVGRYLAFRHVTPGRDNPFFITILISSCTVLIMCPTMSLVATVIFTGVDGQFIANWFDIIRQELPHGAAVAAVCRGACYSVVFSEDLQKAVGGSGRSAALNRAKNAVKRGA